MSASFNCPVESLICTPAVAKALEYLFKSVPSSKVSPSFNPCNLAKIVLNELPIVAADSRVLELTAASAAAALSNESPITGPRDTNCCKPSAISEELDAVRAPKSAITSVKCSRFSEPFA